MAKTRMRLYENYTCYKVSMNGWKQSLEELCSIPTRLLAMLTGEDGVPHFKRRIKMLLRNGLK